MLVLTGIYRGPEKALPYQSSSSYPGAAWQAANYLGTYLSARCVTLRRLRYLTRTFGHLDPVAQAERRYLANLRRARVTRISNATAAS